MEILRRLIIIVFGDILEQFINSRMNIAAALDGNASKIRPLGVCRSNRNFVLRAFFNRWCEYQCGDVMSTEMYHTVRKKLAPLMQYLTFTVGTSSNHLFIISYKYYTQF